MLLMKLMERAIALIPLTLLDPIQFRRAPSALSGVTIVSSSSIAQGNELHFSFVLNIKLWRDYRVTI
jgi:hypothetical protein